MRVHIVPNPIMNKLGLSSKLNAEWDFLSMLKEEGRKSINQAFLSKGIRILIDAPP
jgi:NTE family protein